MDMNMELFRFAEALWEGRFGRHPLMREGVTGRLRLVAFVFVIICTARRAGIVVVVEFNRAQDENCNKSWRHCCNEIGRLLLRMLVRALSHCWHIFGCVGITITAHIADWLHST